MKVLDRQKFGRKEKSSSKWWSDPPKLIPILISLIAVTISCLSWWESHRSRLINEEINRPILALTSLQIATYEEPNQHEDYFPLYLNILPTVKNVGKSTAIVKEFKISPSFYFGNGCKSVGQGHQESIDFMNPLLSGAEVSHIYVFDLMPECRKEQRWYLETEININYVNAGSGVEYTQILRPSFEVEPKDVTRFC